MFLSPSRKLKKSELKQIRPSMFLNEFDISSFTQQTENKKTEQNENSPRKPIVQVGFIQCNTEITESQSVRVLPTVNFMNDMRSSESTLTSITPSRFQSKRKLDYPTSELTSPMSKSELRLPSINSICISPIEPKKFQIKSHRRNQTNVEIPSQQKKVEFRKSIFVIDFINNIIVKDQIDGSVKPLKKKLVRQQTRIIK